MHNLIVLTGVCLSQMEEKDECYSALSTRIEMMEQRPLGSPHIGPRVSSSYVSHYGYPYCLDRYIPIKQNLDPKLIGPTTVEWPPMVGVDMPHEFYVCMMRWFDRQVRQWWSAEVMNGTYSSKREAAHNAKDDVPMGVRISLSWLCGCCALSWEPCGVRWQCYKMYGFLREDGSRYEAGSDVVKAESDSDEAESCDTSVEAVPADTLEVVNMVHNAAGDLDNFFFPAKDILRVCGF